MIFSQAHYNHGLVKAKAGFGLCPILGRFTYSNDILLLFAGIHGAFIGIFIDDILDSVHRKHYPDLPWQKPPTMMQSLNFPSNFSDDDCFEFACLSPSNSWVVYSTNRSFITNCSQWLFTRKEYGQLVEFRIPKNQSESNAPKYFATA